MEYGIFCILFLSEGTNCLATLTSNATQSDFSQFDGELLGQIFDVDQQCRNVFGDESVFLRVSTLSPQYHDTFID